ncbi:MAG: hypothetical protein O9282_08600 [Flavobacterium sp.]|uniref:hypothetical protein n=1 Tax=Flavobacterium sp. TaxID=239 RepID=UPI0022CC7D7A|nr:hypothetical protein [Flavobacterium sp.]MCZ8331357.1 hypothetical protein [Flavobacterium sp.]
MCIVSKNIKFCTCKSTSIEQLNHYWLLHRRNKDKNEIIIGEVMLPSFATYDEKNLKTLETRLNELDAFDFDTDFKNKDILEVVLHNKDVSKRSVYGFEHKKSKWVKKEIDYFYTSGHCDTIQFGKMKKIFLHK